MILSPAYGDRPVLVVDLPPTGPVHPMVAQRRRLQAALGELTDEEWRHRSRCDGWTAQDVITHLTSTNQFWAFSIQAGLGGEPTRFLSTFDPVASPAQMVTDAGAVAPAETLAAFTESSEALVGLVAGLSADEFDVAAEAPPGHLPIGRVADHALWDAWVHERDIFAPLGRPPAEVPDEVRASVRYAATLGLAFAVTQGDAAPGSIVVDLSDPDERFVVAVDDGQVRVHRGEPVGETRELAGPAVEVLEMLSLRDVGRPPPPEVTWLTSGLATVFDQPAGG